MVSKLYLMAEVISTDGRGILEILLSMSTSQMKNIRKVKKRKMNNIKMIFLKEIFRLVSLKPFLDAWSQSVQRKDPVKLRFLQVFNMVIS